MSDLPAPIEVFYSYADADEVLCKELDKHLNLLQRDGLIIPWHKRQIVAGTDWTKTIDQHLNTASVILLLISADFVASDYCYGREMQHAMERHNAGEAHVIPILLRPVDHWQSTPFGKLQALPSNGMPVTKWHNRDEAFADIAKGIRAALSEVLHLAESTPSTLFPRIWNIPHPRNPVFTGREEILSRIHTQLHASQATALSQPQAISGLGGIGKTQIAIEYAYQYHQDYQAILWTLADRREALISGYIDIAGLLNLPEKDEQNQTIIVQAVIRWLTTHTEWFLILDNANDLSIVREFLPPMFGGHLLLTTRAQAMGRLARRIEVDTMPQDIGALFLLRRASLIAPDASLEGAIATDVTIARAICEELGGLPLALDQAGAYVEEIPCSLTDYLHLYRMRKVEMLNERGGLVEDHPASVATTWSLSFEQVEQKNPAAADLLRFCAFLVPDAIPEEIISAGAEHLGPLLQLVACDPLLLNKAIAILGAYSLINRDVEAKTLSIHRLMQVVIIDRMDEQTQREMAKRIVAAVYATLPNDVDHRYWKRYERCLIQALDCVALIDRWQVYTTEAFWLLRQTGWYLKERARYTEVEVLYQYAIKVGKQALGFAHPDVMVPLNGLANHYKEQGKYVQAESWYQQALQIWAQALESMPSKSVASNVVPPLNGLATLYQEQGKYTEAESLYLQALQVCEHILEPEHLNVAYLLTNLATLYQEQGKYTEAEPLYLRAVRIWEKVLGPDHPKVVQLIVNLAALYQAQGKHTEAESLYLRVLQIWEHILGPEHPEIAYPLTNLATLCQGQGKYTQAESLYQRAIQIREQALGLEHPQVAYPLTGLANLYQKQGKYTEAELLYQHAISICERTLGQDHPQTNFVRRNYALLLRARGRELEIIQEEMQDHDIPPPC